MSPEKTADIDLECATETAQEAVPPRTGATSRSRPLVYRLAKHVNRLGRQFGIELRKFHEPSEKPFDNWWCYASLLETAWQRRHSRDTDFETDYVEFCIAHHTDSVAQLFQDLLALFLLRQKRDGFFVEFGATDGISFNNSFLLEKKYGWRGILAEPARSWHSALRRNRNAAIETRCVWGKSDETIEFNEAYAAELSTIDRFSTRDEHALHRRGGQHYSVATISLQDLLRLHDAPRRIDYMSIDTEGSEFAILNNFDFTDYEIALLTVEHNYISPDRENIAALMAQNGFTRILEHYSLFDDWYVNPRLLAGELR